MEQTLSKWRDADEEISLIKKDYDLTDASEIHTGWLLRIYPGHRIGATIGDVPLLHLTD